MKNRVIGEVRHKGAFLGGGGVGVTGSGSVIQDLSDHGGSKESMNP